MRTTRFGYASCAAAGTSMRIAAAVARSFSKRCIIFLPGLALQSRPRMRRQENRLEQPAARDLGIAAVIVAAVVLEHLGAIGAPVARDLPPRHLRVQVVHAVQVVVEEQQAPEAVRLGDRGALARPLAIAMLGERAHPAQPERRPGDAHYVLPPRHAGEAGNVG